jgi:UDP-3-O-[3-hydroxymyristoyl] glucosamine N-acyltransferase
MSVTCNSFAISCAELAKLLDGTLINCPEDRIITEVRPIEEACVSSLSFLANTKYQKRAMESSAGIILVNLKDVLDNKPQLIVSNPYLSFARAIERLHPEPKPEWSSTPIHPTAKIDKNCRIATGATIGARTIISNNACIHHGVHIANDCFVGEGCELFPGVILYRKTILGKRVRIHGNTVIGSDGYGYVLIDNRHIKIPQVGWVEIRDDVEIGSCTTVDRGVLGPTIIETGTKIDNQCQIAHNVQIGKHCLIVSQTGISGSTSLGDYVTLAGKVGTVGHIHIGSKSTVSGNSMIAKDVPDGSFISGYLARPHRQWLECQAALNRLPMVLKKLKI